VEAGFFIYVYICIVAGHPAIKNGRVDCYPIDWFNPAIKNEENKEIQI
jgi:hypothetical protein